MFEMHQEQKHRDDVERRDVGTLKTVDHHRVNIVVPGGIEVKLIETRIGDSPGEMSEVVNDERENNQTAHYHVTRGELCLHISLFDVVFGSRASVFDRKLNREIDMQDHRDQQDDACEPQQDAKVAQMLRVTVDPIRPEKDLEVTEQVADHEQNENHAGNGDDHFPADRGLPKSRAHFALRDAHGRGGG